MTAVKLQDDVKTLYTSGVEKELLKRGYIVAQRPGLNVLRIDPCLTIESDEIKNFLTAFESVLTADADGLP
jgi:4-aminobutyrate aminotransferase-like enzyme